MEVDHTGIAHGLIQIIGHNLLLLQFPLLVLLHLDLVVTRSLLGIDVLEIVENFLQVVIVRKDFLLQTVQSNQVISRDVSLELLLRHILDVLNLSRLLLKYKDLLDLVHDIVPPARELYVDLL